MTRRTGTREIQRTALAMVTEARAAARQHSSMVTPSMFAQQTKKMLKSDVMATARKTPKRGLVHQAVQRRAEQQI